MLRLQLLTDFKKKGEQVAGRNAKICETLQKLADR